jgi:hypothetical protein
MTQAAWEALLRQRSGRLAEYRIVLAEAACMTIVSDADRKDTMQRWGRKVTEARNLATQVQRSLREQVMDVKSMLLSGFGKRIRE